MSKATQWLQAVTFVGVALLGATGCETQEQEHPYVLPKAPAWDEDAQPREHPGVVPTPHEP